MEAGLPPRTDLTLPIVLLRHLEAQSLASRTANWQQLVDARLEPLALALPQSDLPAASGAFALGTNMLGVGNDIEAIAAALVQVQRGAAHAAAVRRGDHAICAVVLARAAPVLPPAS